MIRNIILPLLALWLACAIIGLAVGTAIGHADPGDDYASRHAAQVCSALDRKPTVPGVVEVLHTIQSHGLSGHDSGVALADSVIWICPDHVPLLERFVDQYGKPGVAA